MGGRAAAIAALAATIVATPALAAREAVISAVHAERHGKTLEIHFALSGAPRLNLSRHGNQLWIDLERTRIEIPPRPLFGAETPPLSTLRAIDGGGARSRLVIEVIGKTDYAMGRIPGELLVRLAPAGEVPDIAAPLIVRRPEPRADEALQNTSALKPHPVATRAEPPAASGPILPASAETSPPPAATDRDQRASGRPRVVIDPGHGGHDPGTEDSADHLREKGLALQISRRLASALAERGVGVELTRDADEFLSLPERTRIANRADADLFISIHLNSSPNPDTSGIEVYYLNNTTDRATIRLARMENGGSGGYGAQRRANLNYILSDLRQNYKAAESASLARMIETQTVTELDNAFGLGVRPMGARRGPFYVLVGAHMPAVLVECGFLSNRIEATRLASPAYQARLADGIAAAVVHYLNADLAVGNL